MKRFLADVAKITYGFPFSSDRFNESDGMPLVRIRDVVPGFSNTRTTEYPGQEYEIDDGDILVGMDGEFNIACWRGGRALLNQRVCKITPIGVDKDYLFWFLKNKLKQIETITSAVTVKHLSDKKIKSIVFPSLGKDEQKQIGLRLKTLFSIKNHLQEQLQHLDEQVKSLFNERFGDITISDQGFVSLGSFCDIGSSKRVHASDYVKSGIPFYRSKEIIEMGEGKEPSVELFISQAQFYEIKSRYGVPARGDILMSAVGTIGKMWIVDGERDFYYKDGNILCIHATRANPVYLTFALSQLIEHFKESNVSGSAYPALTIAKLRDLLVPLPNIKEQEVFATRVAKIDKLRFNYQQQLEVLQELMNKKMEEYFGGNGA